MELYNAVETHNVDQVIKILKTDIDINYRDEYGYTPLLIACKKGYLNILKILLTNEKFNINLQNN